MKKLTTTILVLIVLGSTIAISGLATTLDTAELQVNLNIQGYQSLNVNTDDLSSSSRVETSYKVPEPTNKQLEQGYIKETNAIEFVAVSNMDWKVQVKAENEYLGKGNENYKKPISDLSIRGQGEFNQVSTSPQTIASGEPGRHEFSIDYKVDYEEDEPRSVDYEANLVYTISAAH